MNATLSTSSTDFDPGKLADLCAATDEATVQEIVGLFRSDTPQVLASMRTAQAAGDGDGLRKAAHRLKGATGTIGLISAQRLCLDIEQAAKAGKVAGAAALITALEAAIERGLVASGR